MYLKNMLTILFCLLTIGCASWFQEDGDQPVPYVPEPWYQQPWTPFSGAAIKAGYAEADITPFRAQWLAGYGPGRKSKSVIHPLRAQCLALEDDRGEKIMIVSLDLVGVVQDFINNGMVPAITDEARNWLLKTPVYYVNIGPADILTAPGELFPERWEAIKPILNGQPKFIFGLTSEELGYIMSKAYFQSEEYTYYSDLMNIGDEEFGEKLIDVYHQLISP